MSDFQHWQVGELSVTLIREALAPMKLRDMFLTREVDEVIAEEAAWLRPWFVDDAGLATISFHSLVVRSMGATIVVDTCIGDRVISQFPQMSNLGDRFLVDFGVAGFAVDDVTHVVCTHLHFDHVGWNTRLLGSEWVPTFPSAKYLFAREEFDHWAMGAPGAAFTFDTAVRPVIAAGLAEFVEMDHVITPEVRLSPTPGHSPGHVSVWLESAGQRAVITGDVAHHPIQFTDRGIHWSAAADGDPDLAARTRRRFRDEVLDEPILVIGTHFAPPTAGHIETYHGRHRFAVGAASNHRHP